VFLGRGQLSVFLFVVCCSDLDVDFALMSEKEKGS